MRDELAIDFALSDQTLGKTSWAVRKCNGTDCNVTSYSIILSYKYYSNNLISCHTIVYFSLHAASRQPVCDEFTM